MPYKHWTLEDIPWDRFDPARVNPDHLKLAKAAAMVEYNAADYVAYLENVFADDPEFIEAARQWGIEETQHGAALGSYAQMADPSFDFAPRFAAFREGFRPDTSATASVRGSRSGELVARCMVEVGTSSYYTALGEASDEPVFKDICRRIAQDEFRHYKLFYDHLKRWLDREQLNKLRRVRVALGRITETEDDELSYAFYAANNKGEAYDRETCNREYLRRALPYYKDPIVERGLAMVFKAVGLKPHSPLYSAASAGAKWYMHQRQRKLARLAA